MQAHDTLWWQVYPLGAVGFPAGPGLPGLVPWLDHLIGLGLNGLALGPVFASSTHGYDTTDHFSIDPRLGTGEDFDDLVAECRRRGIRVLLDGVFNHVGDRHPLFARAVAEGPGGSGSEYFRFYWNPGDAPGTVPDYECFEGHRPLVALNHASPLVVDLVVDVMCHWLDRGADGWRLDAAYAVPPEFWAQVLARVRTRHPDCYIVGEVIHGDYPRFVTSSGLDTLTQYELWKSVWSALSDQNLHELQWNLGRHAEFLDTFVPWTFLSNHDVTRIASRVEPELLPHATALLCLLPGSPAVYYGDEFGWAGVKEDRPGGDDAVRPPLPSEPVAAVGAHDLTGLYRLYRELLGIRRRHPWLHSARPVVTEVGNTSLAVNLHAREPADGLLRLVLNVGPDPVELPGVGETIAGHGLARGVGRSITLEAHGWAVMQPSGVST